MGLKQEIKRRLPWTLKNEGSDSSLSSAFRFEYFRLVESRKHDPRFEQRGDGLASENGFVLVRATRELKVDHSEDEYLSQVEQVIKEHGSVMTKKEMEKEAASLLARVEIGDMHQVGNSFRKESEFAGIPVGTDENLVIPPGTYGVTGNIDPDFSIAVVSIFWDGFGPENPGRLSWLPLVSLKPNVAFPVEVIEKIGFDEIGSLSGESARLEGMMKLIANNMYNRKYNQFRSMHSPGT